MHGCAKPQKLDKKVLTNAIVRGIITRLSKRGQWYHGKKTRKKRKTFRKPLDKREGMWYTFKAPLRKRKGRKKVFEKTFGKPLDKRMEMCYNNKVAQNAASEELEREPLQDL